MSKIALLNTLRKYEEMSLDENLGHGLEKSERDSQIIKNDMDRCSFRFSRTFRCSFCHKLYIYVLTKVFSDFPLPYFQCMLDIASVILDAYLEEKAFELRSANKKMVGKFKPQITIDSVNAEEKALFEKFMAANKNLIERFEKVLLNVFQRKLLVLASDNFKLYGRLNRVFIYMMSSQKNIVVDPNESLSYMNHTLTFFQRISGNSEVAFKFLNLILNSDSRVVFCILFHFFDKIQNFKGQVVLTDEEEAKEKLIFDLADKDIKEILKIYEDFFQFEKEMQSKGPKVMWCFFWVAASVVVLAAAYKSYSKEKS